MKQALTGLQFEHGGRTQVTAAAPSGSGRRADVAGVFIAGRSAM
jgi:hypothetical protein